MVCPWCAKKFDGRPKQEFCQSACRSAFHSAAREIGHYFAKAMPPGMLAALAATIRQYERAKKSPADDERGKSSG